MKQLVSSKYTWSIFILLLLIAVDVVLHKGIVRVMLGGNTATIQPFNSLLPEQHTLIIKNKNWVKAVNDPSLLARVDSTAGGFECDVYFNEQLNDFIVHHDSASQVKLADILKVYAARKLDVGIWLDFKNLRTANLRASLDRLVEARDSFGLSGKMIIEAGDPGLLSAFASRGFYTSYYVPYFNPYQRDKYVMDSIAGLIAQKLRLSPTAALSGYYFQYPFLKQYFPNYPVLTWSDYSEFSVMSPLFAYKLRDDSHIAVILFPLDSGAF